MTFDELSENFLKWCETICDDEASLISLDADFSINFRKNMVDVVDVDERTAKYYFVYIAESSYTTENIPVVFKFYALEEFVFDDDGDIIKTNTKDFFIDW